MIKLDDDLLQELGLAGLPPEEKKKLLAHIYETLEMRVGMKLAEQMSDAQLTEFEQFIDRNDEGGALKWLETNFPNYKDVVAAEFERLKSEIGQVAPQILATSGGQQQAAPQQPQPPAPAPAQQLPNWQQSLPPSPTQQPRDPAAPQPIQSQPWGASDTALPPPPPPPPSTYAQGSDVGGANNKQRQDDHDSIV